MRRNEAAATHIAIRSSGGPVPGWPYDIPDVDDLVDRDWRPIPFRQFILKLHSRCNLSCTYCYVYQAADQTWKDRPGRMPEKTVRRVTQRIAEHVETHGLEHVEVVLHGGEPLLAGVGQIEIVARAVRDALPPGVEVELTIVTNGTLIDQPALDVFRRHEIRVAVSMDGDPTVHDARRVHPDGRGSFDEVDRSLHLLMDERYRHLFAGILCVIDPSSDPVGTYEHLLRYEPPAVDVLLPHANWSNLPLRPGPSATPYGDWLVELFDRWYGAPRRETSVRLFDEVIRAAFGRPSRVESIGSTPVALVVVETDGTIEQVDTLRSAYSGASGTGLNVWDDAFDAALRHPQVMARQIGLTALSGVCRGCEVVTVCGGGYFPHRYERGTGFRNPSVYCADLSKLIRHVVARVHTDAVPTEAVR
jgi:uncharacterized protein